MIELQHAAKDSAGRLPALSWDYWLWGATEPFTRTAIVCCDKGHVGTANPTIHSISADGTLSPSWVCPFKGCTWHVFAQLVGWNAATPAPRTQEDSRP